MFAVGPVEILLLLIVLSAVGLCLRALLRR
jgi:hypothetical protein